ncbi:hypothetical protein LTR64_006671 [Lithohypha guttulata]|uniref:uncharacterized protein n=1 Tax=Lithohypha guttulata TaxID=1690604 RepID=UPI002DE1201E|nr:hypothetical protein LTR51_004770 [Lithohypha guttulata]
MSAGHSQPHVLYSVQNIRAFHVQNGEEGEITTSGPQELQLLMIPTSSPFADLSTAHPSSTAQEEDFYLHLRLPPELDQPLPATTQIYHKPPSSYLIPRWGLGPDSGAFIRIQFPGIGRGPGKVTQEEVDTFETILAQCTAFLERAPPPDHARYDPSSYRPGEGYANTALPADIKPSHHGQIVLIDEENGSVVGELSGGYALQEAANVRPGSKTPVEIQLPGEGQGNKIQVNNVSEEYLALSKHPAYQKSTIVQTSAKASRLIVTSSSAIANAMTSRADSFTKTSQPNPKPMTFSPATHERLRQLHSLTTGAVGISAKTVGQISKHAQNIGAKMTGQGDAHKRGYKDGKPDTGYKPGILNKSMIAFSTIADGIDQAGRQLLSSGSAAATNVIGHKYGEEAGSAAARVGGGVKNVGLVYIDAAGVSRKALIKSVAKGMVVGRMPNGQQLVVGTGDGGVVPAEAYNQDMKPPGTAHDYYTGSSQAGVNQPGYGVESYGAHANQPPSYTGSGGLGNPAGSALQGQQYPREKHTYN